jgi:translation initiation factor IF-2
MPSFAYMRGPGSERQSIRATPSLPAAGLLRRERGVPLSGPGVRGPAVRPGGAARGGLAANRQRCDRVRGVAPAVAAAASGAARCRPGGGRARDRVGDHELLLLRSDPAPPARDGVGDRVPSGGAAGGGGRALGAERRRARAGGRRGLRPDRCAAARWRVRLRHGLRQRRPVRGLHRARAPPLAGAEPPGDRWAGRGDAGGGGGDRPGRRPGGGAAPARPGGDRRRRRGRHHLLGDPVRVRPARDGAPAPRHLLVDGVDAARDRDRDRDRGAGADSDRATGGGGGAGGRCGCDPPRARPRVRRRARQSAEEGQGLRLTHPRGG